MNNLIFSLSLILFGLALPAYGDTQADMSPRVLTEPFETTIDSETENDFEQYACWRYDRRPQFCRNTYGCVYNYQTRRCVASFGGGGGGGGGSWFTCYARDRGWEEHWSGHLGSARTQWQARQRALYQCQRFHGRCYVSRCDRR